ncbi:macro domain-containing protein [Nocardia alba]|uniref:macro domain-containing protein n=1 Tax=Nocardia alba TaxID=225051 RepID=UPI0020D27000|nr:macro domain-containing protein [Nocardia alba]
MNTVGVMGKGIAAAFRAEFPDMFSDYSEACKRGDLKLGAMHVWEPPVTSTARRVVSFPTKAHWRSPSQIEYIESGMVDLVKVIVDLRINSIALPALGCGNGGLLWQDVRPVIESGLSRLTEVDCRVYVPESKNFG